MGVSMRRMFRGDAQWQGMEGIAGMDRRWVVGRDKKKISREGMGGCKKWVARRDGKFQGTSGFKGSVVRRNRRSSYKGWIVRRDGWFQR